MAEATRSIGPGFPEFFLGGGPQDHQFNGTVYGIIPKNPGAKWWLPSEDEWYEAAHYDPALDGGMVGHHLYPTRSDTLPGNTVGNGENQANYFNGIYATAGSSTLSPTRNYLTGVGNG